MERARKKLASAIDGIRNLTVRTDYDINESLVSDYCCLTEIVRHGFPEDPKCMTFDPVQRLVAIGSSHGSVRLLGQPGVDINLKHDSDEPVLHAQFLVNEGGLITALRDDTIHLWNYRQKRPEIVNSLKMSKERVTCIHLPFQSKWLHVGTDKGNVYFVCIATFELSTYVIMWNKAIDLSCRTHPGSVKAMDVCPSDTSKLLILFEKGQVVLWNIVTKESERFAVDTSAVKCFSWHSDGKQFMCGHKDGSLSVWNLKKPKEIQQKSMPHSPGNSVACRPINHLTWTVNGEGEQMIIFTGGMPSDEGVLPALTILRSKGSITVLEMDHTIIDMLALFSSPYSSTPQQPFATAVLLKNDFLIIDMANNAGGYPCFESPYPMDIHESPVTFLNYISDCPVDLTAALTLVGRHQRKQGIRLSEKTWPINGGVGRECATGHEEIVITGHEDGSLKFWQASSEHLQILYKLKTSRHFEKPTAEARDVSFAVQDVQLCVQSRLLLVASACGQVSLFRFVKTENAQEIQVITIPRLSSNYTSNTTSPKSSNEGSTETTTRAELKRQPENIESNESHSSEQQNSETCEQMPMKVRNGVLKRPAGYQPEIVCQIPWLNQTTAEKVTAMTLNSTYGLVAIATNVGLALVDIVSVSLVYSWTNAELYSKDVAAFSQMGEISPNEAAQSTQTPPQSAASTSTTKSFMRLNTDFKQRSSERSQRPQLSKAQSVAIPHDNTYLEPYCNGETTGRNENILTHTPSTSSLDKTENPDFITTLQFMASPAKRNQLTTEPSLWLGMSNGIVVSFNLVIPPNRLTQTVSVAKTGGAVKLQDQVIELSFMDRDLSLLAAASETFRDPGKDSAPGSANPDKMYQNKVKTKSSLAPTFVPNNDSSSPAEDLQQLGIFVSEHEIKVISLPGYHQIFSYKPDIPLVKSKSTHIRGYPALMCLAASGHLTILSLPTLRVLMTSQLFRRSVEINDPICYKTDFSEHGLGMYMATPSEMQKLTVSSEIKAQVEDCTGELFVPCEMPEPPKNSFLRGVSTLFSSGSKETVDLDAIFSEKPNSTATTSVRSVAKQIPSQASQNLDNAQRHGISAGQAAAMAIQNLNERGDKLSATIDATEQLRNNAMSLQSRSSKLVEKYEKKKWYQL